MRLAVVEAEWIKMSTVEVVAKVGDGGGVVGDGGFVSQIVKFMTGEDARLGEMGYEDALPNKRSADATVCFARYPHCLGICSNEGCKLVEDSNGGWLF